MNIGMLGAGQIARTLARLWIPANHQIALTSRRGPSALASLVTELGAGARALEVSELAGFSDVIVLATRWPELAGAVAALGPVSDTIVIDATNNRTGPRPEDLVDIGGRGSSEVVADLLPSARIVKAFNHLPISALAALGRGTDGPAGALFIAGDDAQAKAVVSGLVRDMGATPIDTGTLRIGGRLQSSGGGPLAGLGRLLSAAEGRDALERALRERRGDGRNSLLAE